MEFTAKSLASFSIPKGKSDHIEFDDALPRFGIRFRNEKASWIFQWSTGSGVTRQTKRLKIGIYPALPLGQASLRRCNARSLASPAARRPDARRRLGSRRSAYRSIRGRKLRRASAERPQCCQHKGRKAPLKGNDFLTSIWRGFLYTPEASTLPPCSLDRSRHWGSYAIRSLTPSRQRQKGG